MDVGQICDFTFALSGCPNLDSLKTVTLISCILHFTMVFIYLIHPIHKAIGYWIYEERFYDGLIYPSFFVCNMQVAITLRLFLLLYCIGNETVTTLRIKIFLDYYGVISGGTGLASFVSYFVSATSGTNLNQLWQVQGQEYNPVIFLALIRIFVTVFNTVLYILWEVFGMSSNDSFKLYRKCEYYFTAAVSAMTAVIYWVLIAKIIQVLTHTLQKKRQQAPKSLYYLQLVKVFIIVGFGIPSTVQNIARVVGNEYFVDSLLSWQVTSEAGYFVTTSCWSIYILSRSFPKYFTTPAPPLNSIEGNLPPISAVTKIT